MDKSMQNLVELFAAIGLAYGHVFLNYELLSWDMAEIIFLGAIVGYTLGTIVKHLKEL